jgi:hypothetical protein
VIALERKPATALQQDAEVRPAMVVKRTAQSPPVSDEVGDHRARAQQADDLCNGICKNGVRDMFQNRSWRRSQARRSVTSRPWHPTCLAWMGRASDPGAHSEVNQDLEASVKLTRLLAWIGVGVVALVGFDQYKTRMASRAEAPAVQVTQARAPAGDPPWGTSRAAPQPLAPAVAAAPVASFRCDGRTHCSQMTSCAEAEFFLRNCPNTKMDGNNDGQPCERQWCN